MADLEREIRDCLAAGMRQYTMAEYKAALANLGYEIEPYSRCPGLSKNMTTGNTYPNVSYGVREIDTKLGAFQVTARRDEKFKALQELRRWSFVVHRGAMVGV